MADNKKNNGEEMSVDELVSLLRDNISSGEMIGNGAEDDAKTVSKKQDPDKDIASMLKKFMPDEDASEDFELDEAETENDEIELDFELDGESEYEVVSGAEALEAENEVFEFDDMGTEVFEEKIAFADAEVEEDLVPEDDAAISEAVSFDVEEVEKAPKKKRAGGLFGLGRKKGVSLADGYTQMLEKELESSSAMFDADMEIALSDNKEEQGVQLSFEDFSEEPTVAEKTDEAPLQEGAFATEELAENTSFEDIFSDDMPELDDLNKKSELSADIDFDSEMAQNSDGNEPKASAAEDNDPVLSQMFVFDNQTKQEPEEEYFAPEKKPLAFDDDDETPFVPDESAFADIAPSDVSEFENAADESGVIENIGAENLDDKDINLMIALGYEEELEKAIGKENVEVISDQLGAEIVDFIDVDNAYAFDGFELNSPDRFRSVGNKYKQEHSLMKLRLLGTGIFAFALLIFELLGDLGITLGGALNIHQYPVVGIMLSLQLLVLAAAMSWRQILSGLYDAVIFNPSPASIPSVAVLMTVIYDLIMALIAPHSALQLYNFPAALCLVFLVLNDYFNLSREIRAFNTIATRRPKYAVSIAKNAEKSAEEEMMSIFVNDIQPNVDAKVLETRRVGFIDNYFRRTNICSQKDRKLCLLIYPFIALAVALGIVSFVTNKSGVTAFNISILTVLFGIPMSALFTQSYPFFNAVKSSFEKDAAIIGEESIAEYSDASSVVFSDKEVFPTEATLTKGIKLYDNNAIYYVLYHLASLYSKIGGPLKERLLQATTELGHSDDVQIISISQKGVEATVDGKVHVLAGQASFMAEKGIAIGYDADDDRMFSEGASALYLVLDGVLSAKLYVNYELDGEIEKVISTLASENMETVIRTSDPNLDDDLLAIKLPISRFPARIIKCTVEENDDVENAEAGIVSRNSLTSLAHTIALCNKIRRVRKTAKKVSLISMIISTIIMVFLAVFSSKLGVPSIYVALYQIFWMLPMFLFTKLYVR